MSTIRMLIRALSVLVVTALFLGTRPAHASFADLRSGNECLERTENLISPEIGSTGVPRNTRIWLSAGWMGPYSLSDGHETRRVQGQRIASGYIVIDPGELSAFTTYTLGFADNTGLTTFTTGGDYDTTPPAQPRIANVSAGSWSDPDFLKRMTTFNFGYEPEPDQHSEPATLSVVSGASSKHSQTFYLPPSTSPNGMVMSACGFVPNSLGELCLEVSVIDLAGNQSLPTRACTTVVKVTSDEPAPSRARFLILLAGVFVGLASLAVAARKRAARRKPAPYVSHPKSQPFGITHRPLQR